MAEDAAAPRERGLRWGDVGRALIGLAGASIGLIIATTLVTDAMLRGRRVIYVAGEKHRLARDEVDARFPRTPGPRAAHHA